MKKTNAHIVKVTSREISFGRNKAELLSLARKMKPAPKRRLGGVSDLHIEMLEGMDEEEIDRMYDTP